MDHSVWQAVGYCGHSAQNWCSAVLSSILASPALTQTASAGFFRDGYCNTSSSDGGKHTVAGVVTPEFLAFSAARGNDLTSILSGGCSWCLCVSRWLEAVKAHEADPSQFPAEIVPKVKLDVRLVPSTNAPGTYLLSVQATHQKALDDVPLKTLEKWAFGSSASKATGEL